jgi:hypothetical protein
MAVSRRVTPAGRIYGPSPDGGNDTFWQSSADSLHPPAPGGLTTRKSLTPCCAPEKTSVYQVGRHFSINHDTYDPHENVAYSVVPTLSISRLLKDPVIRTSHDAAWLT